MTELRIPQQRDEMDEALYAWESAIEDLQKVQLEQIDAESMFKSWEAATKVVYIQTHKMSATLADSKVKGHQLWLEKSLKLNRLSVKLENKKRLCRLAEARWETARSKQVTLRNVR